MTFLNPIQYTYYNQIGTARQTFGSAVLTIFRHGTPNYLRVNRLVPNVMSDTTSGGGGGGVVETLYQK